MSALTSDPIAFPVTAAAPRPAISAWPEVGMLYRRFSELVQQPMRPIRPPEMARVMRHFDERCQGSKRLAERAQAVIPGGVQHNLAFNHPFPLAVAQAEGAYLTDVDGNRYIDFLQAGGPTLLGSNHPAVRQKVNEVLDACGPVTGLLHEYEVKLAELVCQHMPGVEMLRLLGSGSEAVVPRWGWQGAFVALAGLLALVVVLAWWQPAKLAPLAPAAASGFRWSLATALPLAVVFLQLATLGAFWAYLDPLAQAAGFDAEAAQTLIAGVLVMQVMGGSMGALAVRRWPVRPVLALASALLVAATLTVHALPPGRPQAFALACAVFGFVWLGMLPFHIGLAFRADASGRLAGLVPTAQLLGSAFGPLVASFMVQGEDASPVPLASAGFALLAALLLLGTRRKAAVAPV